MCGVNRLNRYHIKTETTIKFIGSQIKCEHAIENTNALQIERWVVNGGDGVGMKHRYTCDMSYGFCFRYAM